MSRMVKMSAWLMRWLPPCRGLFAQVFPEHVMRWVQAARLAPHTDAMVLTDDRAPVEYMVDWLILKEGSRQMR